MPACQHRIRIGELRQGPVQPHHRLRRWTTRKYEVWRAERKLAQLQTAVSVGPEVPLTVIGSDGNGSSSARSRGRTAWPSRCHVV